MIELKKLGKTFGRKTVLKEIDLTFNAGEVIAVMGPNGSGKTTLLKTILGLVIPDTGMVYVNGEDCRKNFEYRKLIGYMPQIANYPENLKVKELFKIVRDIREKNSINDEELIVSFKLQEIMEKNFGQLSGGYKQRVTGAIAFLFHPQILILDEPTASLDPLSNEIMRDKIHRERDKNKLIIMTSHIISEAEELADRIIYIIDGEIVINKLLSELKNGSIEFSLNQKISSVLESIQHTG
ncbi:MAG: ABC transporter ATP-binding protein [Ignavibacteria bacterium]|nr:ABC transporter ATP-binding protein [Ignavibacteria bacterium]